MKRKLSLMVLSLALVCACAMLTACIVIPEQNNKDKKLDSPIDIIIQNISENSIFIFDVIYGEEGGGATEISIDNSTWIDFDNRYGHTFDNLTANTEYTVYARQKGYGEYPASEVFAKKVTTLRSVTTLVPANVTATIYHGTVTLNGVTDKMEVSYDNGATYVTDTTHTYTDKGTKTVYIRYKTTDDYLAGDDLKIKVVYNDFAGGSGTAADPYLIENFDQLMAINTEHYGNAFKLLDDIRFPSTAVKDIIVFSGTFDGNNKKLIAPRFDYTENGDINAYGGIFHANGHDTVIRDLTVENAEITTKASNFVHGLLCNTAKEIINCNVSGKIIVSCMRDRAYLVGGLCGEIADQGIVITNCHADVTVQTVSEESMVTEISCGGLVGKINANCTIENSSAKITALLETPKFYCGYMGGLVGSVEKADAVTISKSWAENDLFMTAIKCYMGGLVAVAPNTDITNCYATGNTIASGSNISSASTCVSGGITAGVEDGNKHTGNIVNCYSAVDITVNKRYSPVTASGIICNAVGTSDSKIDNCLFVGQIRLAGTGTYDVTVDAIASNVGEYSVTNNYIAVASAEGIEVDDSVTTVAEEEYLTATWFKQTLHLDDTVWTLTDGELPELK